jgi:hypothetical protein
MRGPPDVHEFPVRHPPALKRRLGSGASRVVVPSSGLARDRAVGVESVDPHRFQREDTMYATIRIYAQAEGLADAVAENRAEIVRLFEEIGGFRSYHIVKTGPSSATSITVFDTKEGVEASTRVAGDWIAANLGGLKIEAPDVLVGEVAMSA